MGGLHYDLLLLLQLFSEQSDLSKDPSVPSCLPLAFSFIGKRAPKREEEEEEE